MATVILERLRFLVSRPHPRLMVHSAILWGLGDVAAQAVTHCSSSQDKSKESISVGEKDEEFKIDWNRVHYTSLFGLGACIGPAAYYRFTDILLRRSSIVTAKVIAAGTAALDGVFGTLNVAGFFPLMGFVRGSTNNTYTVAQAKEDVKRGFTPALVLGGLMLPAAQFMNWRFVPAPHQLRCASLFALVGSGSLSWVELHYHKRMMTHKHAVKRTLNN